MRILRQGESQNAVECLVKMGYWTIERHKGCRLTRLRTRLTNAFVFDDKVYFQTNAPKGLRCLLGSIKCKLDERRLDRLMERYV